MSQRTRKSPSGQSKGPQATGGQTCAECRRLKIRCDRKVPCEQCKRRGCASICPEGQLVPAHGNGSNRITGQVPNNIDAIYRKLDSFSQRIKELEAALHDSHVQLSTESHALLAPDLVRLTKEDDEAMTDDSSASGDGRGDEMITLAFGSLLNGPNDTTRYLGPSASSAWIFQREPVSLPTFDDLPPAIALHSSPTSSSGQLRAHIEAYLPAKDVLRSLIGSYFKYSLGIFQPLTPLRVTEDCVVPSVNALSPAQLSLLCIILALAAHLDPTPSPHWHHSTTYYALSRAALSLEDIHAQTSIETVESIGLQSLFILHFDNISVPERAWAGVGQAMKCAQAIGLHRDSKRWGLKDEVVQRRRRTFYELWTFDIFLSASLGRPPSLNKFQVDCIMPSDDPVSLGQDPTFFRWKHQQWSTTLLEVATSALASVQPPSYSTIISLDKQLRASPPVDKLPGSSDPCRLVDRSQYPQISVRWQEHAVHMMNNYTLIFLHRPFFARAILESPDDIFKHRFLRSVMTVMTAQRQSLITFRGFCKMNPKAYEPLFFGGWPSSVAWCHCMRSLSRHLIVPCLRTASKIWIEATKPSSVWDHYPHRLTLCSTSFHKCAHGAAVSATPHVQPSEQSTLSVPQTTLFEATTTPQLVSPIVLPSLPSTSASTSRQCSPGSSVNLSVPPFTPRGGPSNPPSPMLRSENTPVPSAGEYDGASWTFPEYMQSHSRNTSGMSLSGSNEVPLYIVPSHAEVPHSAMSMSTFGDTSGSSVYASPYPLSPENYHQHQQQIQQFSPRHGMHGHHSGFSQQLGSPGGTASDIGNVSWEQFMSSMGL